MFRVAQFRKRDKGNEQVQKYRTIPKLASDSGSSAYGHATSEEHLVTFQGEQSSHKGVTGNPMKKLLAYEMSKEAVAKKKSPSVIAKFIGLDGASSSKLDQKQNKGLWDKYTKRASSVGVDSKSSKKNSAEMDRIKNMFNYQEPSNVPKYHKSAKQRNFEEELAFLRKKNEEILRESEIHKNWRGKSNQEVLEEFIQEPDPLIIKHVLGQRGSHSCTHFNHIALTRSTNAFNNEASTKGWKDVRETEERGSSRMSETDYYERRDHRLLELYGNRGTHTSLLSSKIQVEASLGRSNNVTNKTVNNTDAVMFSDSSSELIPLLSACAIGDGNSSVLQDVSDFQEPSNGKPEAESDALQLPVPEPEREPEPNSETSEVSKEAGDHSPVFTLEVPSTENLFSGFDSLERVDADIQELRIHLNQIITGSNDEVAFDKEGVVEEAERQEEVEKQEEVVFDKEGSVEEAPGFDSLERVNADIQGSNDEVAFKKEGVVEEAEKQEEVEKQEKVVFDKEGSVEEAPGFDSFERVNADIQELRMHLNQLKMGSDEEVAFDKEGFVEEAEEKEEVAFDEEELFEYDLWNSMYTIDLLVESGLYGTDPGSFISNCYSPDSPLDPSCFDILERKYTDEITGSKQLREILYDHVNELLVEIYQSVMESYPWVKSRVGFGLKWENGGVEEQLGNLLDYYQKEAQKNVLDTVLDKSESWYEPREVVDEIGKKIQELILDDLIMEVIKM